MRGLSQEETFSIAAGVDNLSLYALSAIGGTLLGAGTGSAFALYITVPTTLSLFPIWVAAATGAGGAIGLFAGLAFAFGGAGINCYDLSNE